LVGRSIRQKTCRFCSSLRFVGALELLLLYLNRSAGAAHAGSEMDWLHIFDFCNPFPRIGNSDTQHDCAAQVLCLCVCVAADHILSYTCVIQ
jgi:hypothetical protein